MKTAPTTTRAMIVMAFTVLLAIIASAFPRLAQAGQEVVPNGAQGQVVVNDQSFMVWVYHGTQAYEVIALLDHPVGHPEAIRSLTALRKAVTPPDCRSYTMKLDQLSRLVQLNITCVGNTRPDARVQYPPNADAPAKPRLGMTPASYIEMHRGWVWPKPKKT